jgi:Holliday junction resolvasome RuvABC endonuclease subunit
VRVLSIDPGAKRLGWAVLEGTADDVRYYDSGLFGVERDEVEKYHPYRLRVVQRSAEWAVKILDRWKPDVVVSETLPIKGFNNSGQALLAGAAITSIQAIAATKGYVVSQIGATTIKCQIAGSGRATKVGVRNGVVSILPELAKAAKGWTKEFDEPDAIAVGLAYLGHDVR